MNKLYNNGKRGIRMIVLPRLIKLKFNMLIEYKEA